MKATITFEICLFHAFRLVGADNFYTSLSNSDCSFSFQVFGSSAKLNLPGDDDSKLCKLPQITYYILIVVIVSRGSPGAAPKRLKRFRKDFAEAL